MAAAVKAEHRHPGGAGCGDAGHAVLDHDAALGPGFHLPGGKQKKIGRRLAALDLQGRKNVRRKPIIKAGVAEA